MAFVVVVLFHFIIIFFYIYFKRLTCTSFKTHSVADALAECYKNAGHWGSRREILSIRDGPLEKLGGGVGNIFSLSNSFMNFSYRP